MRRKQPDPESIGKKTCSQRPENRQNIPSRMLFEQIEMPPPIRVEEIGPIEFIAAFRTAGLGCAAK
jgi:hypothetical protein